MTIADLKNAERDRSSPGLAPPPATPQAILADLRWHWAVYREDGLPLRDRLAFLGLRIVQRLGYNAGWRAGA